MTELISYVDARNLILDQDTSSLAFEPLPTSDAVGRVLHKDVMSQVPHPLFRNSAMDGYALCASDLELVLGDASRSLKVVGELPAGGAVEEINWSPGEAYEITTGSAVPAPLDTVVRLEDTTEEILSDSESRQIRITSKIPLGANIRPAGSDFKAGELLLQRGTPLGPQHIPLLLAGGILEVPAIQPPRVAVVSTGNELVECLDGSVQDLPFGMIYNSCAPLLLHSLTRVGASPRYFGIVQDDPAAFHSLLDSVLEWEPHLILTTGAVSKGRYDFVPQAVVDLGARKLFHKVAIRPGKPLFSALHTHNGGATLFIGLPGNPLSVFAGFRFFVVPYLRRLMNIPQEDGNTVELTTPLKKPVALRRFFLGEVVNDSSGSRFGSDQGQMSYMLGPVQRANSWAVLPEGQEVIEAGSCVDCYPLYPE